MMRPYVAQELQPLLHAGTTYARGLFGTLKLPDSFLIYYQLIITEVSHGYTLCSGQIRYHKVLANTSRLNNFVTYKFQ